MNTVSDWKVPKWPFLTTYLLLMVAASVMVFRAAHPISPTEVITITVTVVVAAVLGCLPFVLEYRATCKLLEADAVGTVAAQLQDLDKYAAQIAHATEQWAHVQETTKIGAEKTVTAAKEIAERMANEVREFNEFQAKMNDGEKAALRLETEKLHRAEGEWLQVLARILDHIFALHNAAARSGQPELAEQITNFQNACRDISRRVGLNAFAANAQEPFDAERHRAHGVEQPPVGAVVEETLAPGLTFQGRLIRPVLVRLQEKVVATPPQETAPGEEISGANNLPFDAD